MEKVRLNKYLSDKGIVSRREADRMVNEGRITVNGAPAEMGVRVSDEDAITLDGNPITKQKIKKIIIAVYKPVGVVCTTRTFRGEENIVNMVDYPTRLYPVGRLDKDSEGLIFLTNDGAFAEKVTKASGRHEKEYEVVVDKELEDRDIKRLEKGVYLKDLDRTTAEAKVVKKGDRRFSIILTQGLNRQIRRMCQTFGYEVLSLKRVRIMSITLNGLKPGEWRELSGREMAALRAEL